ncbi:MAG: ATP-dependent 6-phosphofructokinase [Proteobacteria bacterium]|nr:ATP-dependent 6-phosphofructokinase [Pseudomonadota bacterium]
MSEFLDFSIETLGPCKVPSPIHLSTRINDFVANFVSDDEKIIYNIDQCLTPGCERIDSSFEATQLIEKAGPREKIYFDPKKVCAGIVTCGGLCPGLNDVIRSLVMTLWYQYGVRNILGIPYGYCGFLPEYGYEPIRLDPKIVSSIHQDGGTMLGSSRGGSQTDVIMDSIEQMNINILFTIGGDGTQHGAQAILEEAQRRGRKISIIGIPKTIDNDLSFIQRSFGFETAVSQAVRVVDAAHVEASGAINGVGLVKVMGRESGFIATNTALASNDVNFVLIPEVPFDIEGPNSLWENLKARLERRHHAVILVAEGAGQNHLADLGNVDASGNKVLSDIGVFLKNRIKELAKRDKLPINLKYIDPSYIIRGSAANPNDSIYCSRLGANAVHAAMSGKTGVLMSMIHDRYVHVPIKLSIGRRNVVDPEGDLWRDVIIQTGQPPLMVNNPPAQFGQYGR